MDEKRFETSPALLDKADGSGRLLPFAGSTVVYYLDEESRKWIGMRQKELYALCGDMLAEPLGEETFHMTLHDLINGPDNPSTWQRVQEKKEEVLAILKEARGLAQKPVRMYTKGAVNMADTSVVLTLQAADAKSKERLAALYERFQAAVPLAVPLTPHITLAYYRPGVYERDMADRIMEAIERLNAVEPKEIFLENERLKYQEFTDMNHYRG